MSASSSKLSQSSSPEPRNPWIVDCRHDLVWFVASPLLLVPIFYGLLQKFSLGQVSIFVITLGAVGHHLPGMIRAYGDAELFAQYRVRFILAPVFLVVTSVFYSFHRPDALGLLLLTWGFWHSQAQVYGFLRIYDSKVGLTDQPSAWVDRFVCLTWFMGGILFSDGRVTDFLKVYYSIGGYPIESSMITGIRAVVLVLMGLSVSCYSFRLIQQRWLGRSPNPVKLLTLILSVGFWWYCMVGIRNVVLGVLMYEVFHDVQYLAIVWFFNRRRAESGPSAGWITRFLFRPRARLVFVYVGLVLLYGAGSLFAKSLEVSALQTTLTGLFAASGLLHFYYDGFIWRIRDKKTSQTLGVENRTEVSRVLSSSTNFRHMLLWLLFIIPLTLFTFTTEREEIHTEVVRTLPESAEAHLNYSSWLLEQGDLEGAENHLRVAKRVHPDWWKAWTLQGELELARGRASDAVSSLRRAAEMQPLDAVTQFNLGDALMLANRIPEGVAAFEVAIQLNPEYETSAYNNLGLAMLRVGAPHDAEAAFRKSIESGPANLSARMSLGIALSRQGKLDEAIEVYEDILDNRPDFREAYTALISLLLYDERLKDAELWGERFRRMFTQDAESHAFWGLIQLQQQNEKQAFESLVQALSLDQQNFKAHFGLAQLAYIKKNHSESLRILNKLEQISGLSALERQQIQSLKRELTSERR